MSAVKAPRGSHIAAITKALAECEARGAKYKNMAELCRAIGITEYSAQVAVRQHFRDAGLGVGRGNVYSGVTPTKVDAVVKGNAKAEKGKAKAKAAEPAKKRAAAKAVAIAPGA